MHTVIKIRTATSLTSLRHWIYYSILITDSDTVNIGDGEYIYLVTTDSVRAMRELMQIDDQILDFNIRSTTGA